jgi:ribosome-associated protein
MGKKNRPAPAENLSKYIVKGIQEKKGKDIVIIDLQRIKHAICDYFIICTGTSDTHVDTIADSVEKEVIESNKERPWHREGFENKEWILLDYVDIVVHIFKQDVRSYYKLEELWGDAAITRIEDL